MKEQLKKGDRCQSPWGVVTVTNTYTGRDEVDLQTSSGEHRRYQSTHLLTRVPTHAERMQKVIDNTFDAENRLEPHETVQFTVEDMAAFVRHYCKLRDALQSFIDANKQYVRDSSEATELTEKLLKGEA